MPARSPRRAPSAAQRGQAAEQTRERILDAAIREFGAKGYAGARTAGIAERAGVNQQLIAYYFGGKQGVLDELRRRWADRSATLAAAETTTFDESFAAYLDATLDEPDWARLVIWRALGDDATAADPPSGTAQAEQLRAACDRIRRRQRDGELTVDLEPEFVLLLSYALAFAPIALPGVVGALFDPDGTDGTDGPDGPDSGYRRRCREQLRAVLRP